MAKLADLNLKAQNNQSYEFEYIDPNDEPTGIFFSVIGGHSDKIVRLASEQRDKQLLTESMAAKKGKDVPIETTEKQLANRAKLNAARLVGWRGIDEPFTDENALLLVSNNAHISEAIARESEDMRNFTKANSTTLSSSPSLNLN